MSINLASKYSDKIAERFTRASFLQGRTSKDYDWQGVRSISVYTPQTVGLNDYERAGQNRFGAPVELQDELQIMTLTQDKGFSITIDRGNNEDQRLVKNAGKILSQQIAEQVAPYMDKYAFQAFCAKAGQIVGMSRPTKQTVVEALFDAAKDLDNALVPDEGRILYLPTSVYNLVRLSPEFIGVDKLGERALSKGEVGSIADMQAVKVPDAYLPKGVFFLIAYKGSVLFPNKIKTARVLTEVQGIDGAVLEGRNYFDAFVLGAKANGVYAAVQADKVTDPPAINRSGASATMTAADGAAITYTLDGSDPRYSKTAQTYGAPVAVAQGQVPRAFACAPDKFPSAVVQG